jgi:dienelactone hydrolase
MAQHGHGAACCSIPPIVSKGYQAKGEYKTIGGLKTCTFPVLLRLQSNNINPDVTGPANASKALLYIYDIFGYFDQSIQGADILATSDKDNNYQVFIPDFFEGSPADISWYPPDTDEKGQKLGNFFQTTGAPPASAARIPGLIKAFNDHNPSIKSWGVVGFCWGGKIVSLTSGKDTLYKAAAECHPAMVDPAEAENISIPLAMLASKDEPEKDVRAFEGKLKGEKHVEIFGDQIHGWMAARADLGDERVKGEYERGYRTLLEFFARFL